MNRLLAWFLVALIFAMSGPLQAATMASARGFEKSLYGRSAPWADKYAYCNGDPIGGSDPDGLQPHPDEFDDGGYGASRARFKASVKTGTQTVNETGRILMDEAKNEAKNPLNYVAPALAGASKLRKAARLMEVTKHNAKNLQNLARGTEFVYDGERMIVGATKHPNIVRRANVTGSPIVGGMVRGKNGVIHTNEVSGHYGSNWTDEIADSFQRFLQNFGVDASHSRWPNGK